jgi:hypothetical protein
LFEVLVTVAVQVDGEPEAEFAVSAEGPDLVGAVAMAASQAVLEAGAVAGWEVNSG